MDTRTLPRHSRLGVQAVGWRKPRPGEVGAQPIWPILGAAEDDSDDDGQNEDAGDADDQADDSDGDEDDKPEGADQLGDAGKKALDAIKARARTERERRKAAEQELATLKAAQKPKPKDGSDQVDAAPDVEEIRREAQAEARSEALRERALDRLEAKAARRFADPEDARAFLSGHVEEFIDGDRVDNEAIAEALDELLQKRPYLGSEQAAMQQKRFKDSGDGGARQGQSPKGQLTQEDLRGMTPAQIRKAKADGRLDTVLGRK
jgi:hypothetical protein